MKFTNVNHHKSGTIEKWASSLAALEYILEFRKKNFILFNVLFTLAAFAILIIISLIALVYSVQFPTAMLIVIIISVLIFIVLEIITWRKPRKHGNSVNHNNSREQQRKYNGKR